MNSNSMTRRAFCGAGAVALAGSAWSQGYPAKPIKLVVPYLAGGTTDALARMVAENMGQQLKQAVVVDNQPGANGLLGTEVVRRAPADGYTLLFTLTSIVQNPLLYPQAKYDPFQDFTPISEIARLPVVLVVNASLGINTLAEFVKAAREKPGHYSYASQGSGSSPHLYMEILQDQAKVKLVHVPYKGEAASMTNLLGGTLNAAVVGPRAALPHLESGKLKALAVVGAARAPMLPNVPTFKEQGFAEMESNGFFCMFGPAGLSPAMATTLSQAASQAMRDPELMRKAGELGAVPRGLGPVELTAAMHEDHNRWAKVIKAKNIKLE